MGQVLKTESNSKQEKLQKDNNDKFIRLSNKY